MKSLWLFLFLFAFGSCIDPLNLDLPSVRLALVVDGQITNTEGPYFVKLFHAGPLGSTLKKLTPERGAIVTITSDEGEFEQLFETSPGIYSTSPIGIRGELGRAYQLTIETKSGRKYQSTMQKLMDPGTLDTLYTAFEEKSVHTGEPTDNGPQNDLVDALSLYVDAHGVVDEQTLLRWRVTGLFEMRTFPERNREATPGGYVPDPLECSGYVRSGLGIKKVGECTCCTCYRYEYSSDAFISDNENVADLTFNKVHLGKIPVTGMRFYNKYFVEIEQMSISEDVHNFWKLVRVQQQSTGNIFQPNAVKVRGNIKCTSDPSEEVLGIFSASGIIKSSMFIYPEDLPYQLPIDTLAVDCRGYENSTTYKPIFW